MPEHETFHVRHSMNSETIFVLILIFLTVDFILERLLSLLNIKHSKLPLPQLISDIYDTEKYRKQQEYFRVNSSFGMITSTFSFTLIMLMLFLRGFGWLDGLVSNISENEIIRSLVFFGILFIVNDLISIPFEWYDTFVIEERFGFNKTTRKTFLLDKLKGYLLTIIIGGLLLTAIIYIYQFTPEYFWLIAWSLVTVFSLFMGMFYSELIVPLFNKQTPLPEGELRSEIENFAQKSGFKLKNIYQIDGSKRSTKANAYFTGLGPKKRIVLYDTLMDKLSTQEIVAVLAHEVGHYKHKHTLKSMLVSLPATLLMFYLLGLFLDSDSLAQSLGGQTANFHLNIIVFGILYSPVSLIIDLGGNILSRKFEYQADNFANKYGFGNELISGLKKLSATSLSNLMPHPLNVFLHYSHPTLYQRIKNITPNP